VCLFQIFCFDFYTQKNVCIYDLGVVAFVDYKIDNDRSASSIIECLIEMGAKVEKTFNQKVI